MTLPGLAIKPVLRLRPDLFRAAVRRMTGGRAVTFGTSDPAYRDWLIARRLPEELMHFLMENALNSEVSFDGTGGMWTPELVMRLNDQEEALSSCGLFGVGNAINGDFIVIDFGPGNGTSGFVDHDELARKGPSDDVRDAFASVARSIGGMLHGMTAVEGFPHDYWGTRRGPVPFDPDLFEEPWAPCPDQRQLEFPDDDD
jgi:hypothetical protein